MSELRALLNEWVNRHVELGRGSMLHLEQYTQPQPIDYQRL